jgi:hypothetical protein
MFLLGGITWERARSTAQSNPASPFVLGASWRSRVCGAIKACSSQAADRPQLYISYGREHFRTLPKQGILAKFGVSAFLLRSIYLEITTILLSILHYVEFSTVSRK